MKSVAHFDVEDLENILEQEGYKPDDHFDTKFRYTVLEEPEITVILGVKIPIIIPIIHSPPIELASFYISYAFRPNWLDENFGVLTRFLATSFRETVQKLEPYTHDFNLDRYKQVIIDKVGRYFPSQETIDAESLNSETKVNSMIRENILQDKENFNQFNLKISQDIFDIYHEFHLKPTNDVPPEMLSGFPRSRRNLVVIFTNDASDEYLLIEPGSVNYWRDYTNKNVWIRTGLSSYTAPIWYLAFQDQNYRMNYLYYDWIIYCRGLLRPFIEAINNPQFESHHVKAFNSFQYLKDTLQRTEAPAVFLPQIVYEIRKTPDKYPRDQALFESPPSSLEEMSTIEDYSQAEILSQKGNYTEARKILMDTYRKLKKFHHSKGLIKVLFGLHELAKAQNDLKLSVKIMNEAIELAKSGKVPIADVIQIHLSLAYAYAMLGDNEGFEREFIITINFLEALPKSTVSQNLLLKTHLETAKIRLAQGNPQIANEHFKSVYKEMEKNPVYQFLYYYERSFYYSAINKEQKQILCLQKAIAIPDGSIKLHIQANIELGKIYLYTKKDPQKAVQFLLKAEQLNQGMEIDNLRIKVKTYEMLADAYQSSKDDTGAKRARSEADVLRERVDRMA